MWWMERRSTNRCRVKGTRHVDSIACPQCCTWRDPPMFAPRLSKRPCKTCTACRDARVARGPSKKQLECRAVHTAWKQRQVTCAWCGDAFNVDDDVETDHIDETKKECRGANFSNYSWYASHGGASRLERDLSDNAQLLHTKCHRAKTSAARQRKRDPSVIEAFTVGAGHRTCTSCKRSAPPDQFVSNTTRQPTWTKKCQSCRNDVNKSNANPSTIRGGIRKRYRDEKATLDKSGTCACGCGVALRGRAFDFDHIVPVKDNLRPRLSDYYNFRSIDDWERERALCRPLLTRCHRKMTAQNFRIPATGSESLPHEPNPNPLNAVASS